ncbi:hypothetical protein GALMADRAFT_96584 [Galerina marginata CBS 339.88]|uniref:G domain-containing protein n=1 Tax=Galerina marginata (strain CBS 339.88) TaxID=685588 RepID=A0A067T1C6_GALM3|nr:hypothetical protein GALMADRAFT_96584 [Galerina marginata CBS 339.88]
MLDVNIAVMGATGSGKTTFVNLASSSNLSVGHGLQSCTSRVQVSSQFELDGRSVTLIDTPGFDDTTTSDMDILRQISEFLSKTYKDGKRLSGVLYIHRISDFRVGGISRRNFKMFRELCGERTLVNVIIVTNMWGDVSKEIGEQREDQLATQDIFFKPTLEKGARLLRHDATRDSTHNILRHIIDNHPLPLQIQQEIVEQARDIGETSAGIELQNEFIIAEAEKHQEELRKLHQEAEEAIRVKEEENRRRMEMEAKKHEEERLRVEDEARKLAAELERQRLEVEKSLREAAERVRKEAEIAEAEFQRQAHELQLQIQRAAEEKARREAEQAEFQRQAHELQQQIQRAAEQDFGRQLENFGRQVDEGAKWFFGQVGHTLFGW